jgi:hypothetical protein
MMQSPLSEIRSGVKLNRVSRYKNGKERATAAQSSQPTEYVQV